MYMQVPSRCAACAIALASLTLGAGCVPRTVNPQFPMPTDDASRQLAECARTPVAHARPILVLGGYMDPGFASGSLERSLRRAFAPGTTILAVSFGDCTSMSQCRDRVLAATQAIRDADPDCTFDVVANSMGGLIARYCALPPATVTQCGMPPPVPSGTLRIRHLYTICTPHAGARMAEGAFGSSMTQDMRPGSAFLSCLDAALPHADYALTCFAREGDSIVGADRSAPPGTEPILFDTPPLELSHVDAHRDPRILLVIVRSLRGDASLPLGE
jgi:pimeloyl-ACP methyl ester carboxylesterase